MLSLRLSFFTDEKNITRAHLGHTDTQTLAAKSNTISAMCLCGSLVVEQLSSAKEAKRDLVSMCGLTSTDIYMARSVDRHCDDDGRLCLSGFYILAAFSFFSHTVTVCLPFSPKERLRIFNFNVVV